ncbi:MAG: exosome complex RNA-binding protein Csl4 [Promethearchaeota archaeon]
MENNEIKPGDLVIPGQKLAVIEMYVPGEGTYIKNDVIYASIVGEVYIDSHEKKVSVISKGNKPTLPKKGDIVIGSINMVRKQMAIADITNKPGYNPTTDFEGMIHISQVSKSYLENLSDAFKTSDIIRAVVIDDEKIPFFLSTAGPDFGVIRAYCSECGYVLKPVGRRLQCPNCRTIENRKIARSYGTHTI